MRAAAVGPAARSRTAARSLAARSPLARFAPAACLAGDDLSLNNPTHPHSPAPALRAARLLVGHSCGWAWAAVRAAPLPLHPLRSAMLNVTADYDQVGPAGWAGGRGRGAARGGAAARPRARLGSAARFT